MPTSDSIAQLRTGRYSVVQAETPEQGLVNIGVLLEDPESDSLRLRFRRDLDSLVLEEDEEDLAVLRALGDDLAQKAREMGAEKLFEYLESNLSGAIRVTDREEVLVEDYGRALDRLYLKNVQSNVLEFRTHLPRYSLRAAAGKFLENQEISEDGWVEAPEDLRLSTDMFVAQIAGHSMEPRIPDGSLCVFRYGVAGSRQGRLVLVENRENAADQYTVKRYESTKTESGDTGAWAHARIRLESLNPGYPSWDLDPDEDKYRILAEFVRVLD
jgi:SOS-response transcriptional repressor LexA